MTDVDHRSAAGRLMASTAFFKNWIFKNALVSLLEHHFSQV